MFPLTTFRTGDSIAKMIALVILRDRSSDSDSDSNRQLRRDTPILPFPLTFKYSFFDYW
jgi:hypothetical protein